MEKLRRNIEEENGDKERGGRKGSEEVDEGLNGGL